MDEGVTATILTQLAKLPVPDALAALAAAEMLTPAAAAKAAQLALAAAPMQPDQAARWLQLVAGCSLYQAGQVGSHRCFVRIQPWLLKRR